MTMARVDGDLCARVCVSVMCMLADYLSSGDGNDDGDGNDASIVYICVIAYMHMDTIYCVCARWTDDSKWIIGNDDELRRW